MHKSLTSDFVTLFLIVLAMFALIIQPENTRSSAAAAHQTAHTFVVTTTADVGPGSLRQAILDANAVPGHDTIAFDIPGDGVRTISLTQLMPAITESIIIDGYTQPGSTPATADTPASLLIRIHGADIPIESSYDGYHWRGLDFSNSDNHTVRGLIFTGWNYGIFLNYSNNNVIEGNYVGHYPPDGPGGDSQGINRANLYIRRSSYNRIGGPTPAARNIFGLSRMFLSEASYTEIQGNIFGTDPNYEECWGPGRYYTFIELENGSSVNQIGGSSPGEGNLFACGTVGISIEEFDLFSRPTQNVISGNTFGFNNPQPQNMMMHTAIYAPDARETIIGGLEPGAGNVIGNMLLEAVVVGNYDNQILGNIIGLDAQGLTPAGVGQASRSPSSAIVVQGNRTLIKGNIIANSLGHGIEVRHTQNTIEDNLIGTDITGTKPMPHRGHGIYFLYPSNQVVRDNMIVASDLSGIYFRSGIPQSHDVTLEISGNFIGTNPAGDPHLANGHYGIEIYDLHDYLIANNTVAYNAYGGIFIAGTSYSNTLTANRIFGNGGMEIELVPSGPTPNDQLDADTGPNELQNYPVVASASEDTIIGSLHSSANTTFQLEFFGNTTCDPSGYGGGEFLVDLNSSSQVTTDGAGDADFVVTYTTGLPHGYFVTATATDPDGNTSEFSACQMVEWSTPNAPPENQVPAQQQTAYLGWVFIFDSAHANAIQVSDPDAGEALLTIKLEVTLGHLTLSRTVGLTFVHGDGVHDDGLIEFSGTLTDINAALDGFRYVSPNDVLGSAELTITTDDLGHNGAGGAMSDSDTLVIEIVAPPGGCYPLSDGSVICTTG